MNYDIRTLDVHFFNGNIEGNVKAALRVLGFYSKAKIDVNPDHPPMKGIQRNMT